MQNLFRKVLNIGLLASLSLFCQQKATAQTDKQKNRHAWLQPDLKYVDKRSFSLGATFGMSDLWADVGTRGPLDHYSSSDYWNNVKGMGGIFMKYTHVPGLALRAGVSNGTLYANDVWNREKANQASDLYDDAVQRYYRNLDVKTNVWEGNLMFEISPFQLFGNWEFGRLSNMRFQPYLLGGVAGVFFNPRGSLINFENDTRQWVDLRPLATEGQNFDKEGFPEPYSRYTLAIPFGLGFRVDISKRMSVGMEYIMRYTFTDYLDDASGKYIDPRLYEIAYLNENPNKVYQSQRMQNRTPEILPGTTHPKDALRGDPSTKDLYSTISVNFYWRLFKKASPWWN